MCLQKRRIKNRVLDNHLTGFDKYELSVNCGKCCECRKDKSNDWVFRSYFHFMKDNKPAYFVTLTFDDEHLPRYNGKPCFDMELFKKFRKCLRYYLGKFDYLMVNEYGGITHRPHIHLILIPELPWSIEGVHEKVRKSWPNGVIDSVDAIRSVSGSRAMAVKYITQYTTKDLTFDAFAYEEGMPLRYCQQTRASKGYGASAPITIEDLKRGFMYLPLGKDGTAVRYKIPRYYEIKLCYDYIWNKDEQKVELPKNELGMDLSIFRHNRCYVYKMEEFLASRFTHSSLLSVPYGSWFDALNEVSEYKESLAEFFYLYDFVESSHHNIVKLHIDGRIESLYWPEFFHYKYLYDIFLNYKRNVSHSKNVIAMEKMLEDTKKHYRNKIKSDIRLQRWIRYRGIDISHLY